MTKPDRTKTPIGRGYRISFSWVMILSIVSAVLLPVREVQAQFNIGVWQPGGHTAGDKAFASSDVTDLSALGIDLLVDSTPRIESNPGTPTFVQDFEETIMGLWTGSNRRAAIYYEPENVSPGLLTLEHYAGRTNSINQTELNNKVLALLAKWGSSPYLPAFYGYRIGHEAAPNGYGIYNSATYGNLQQVINTIRAYDTARRIIAIGVVTDQQWASAARDSFVTYFFQPSTGGSPANILQNEYYPITTDNTEAGVQSKLNNLISSFNICNGMVQTAINLAQGRKAEWSFTVNAIKQAQHNTVTGALIDSLRFPTYPELKVQAYLALTRGAKGVTYFCYTSSNGQLSDGWTYWGIVNTDHSQRQPYWNRVKSVNDTLRVIGDSLYAKTWVRGFSRSNIPAGSLVVSGGGSSDSLEFGTFKDTNNGNKDYLLVVNKKNVFSDSISASPQTVSITLNANNLQATAKGQGIYFLTDVVSGARQVRNTDANGQFVLRNVPLKPGEGRLFRIEQANTWTGTVYIGGDVTVPAGVTLTIAAGTTVNVLTGDDLAGGTWTDRAELIVQGTGILNAVGTSGSPITFKSADNPTGKDAWGGIRVQSGGSATFRYVTVQNAREAVYQAGSINWGTAADAATKINNSLTGIRASGLNAQTIDDADMDEVFTAVLLENNSTSTTIQHIRAKQVTPSNDPIIKVTGGSSNHVENTTLIGSANVYLGTGILLENTSSPQILNNHIQSVGLGIQGTGNTSNVSITYNNLWNIGLQAFSGVSVSTTNYAVEPRFKAVTPPTFELETNSPLINAGTPSGRDMGRYGGTTLDQTTAQASIFFSTSYVQDHSGFTPVSGSWSYDGPNQWYSQTDPWAGPSRSTHGGSSAASCTIGAKVRMTGGYSYGELKLIYANANVDESYRIDLMYGYQKVRLITAAGTWEQPNVTLTANTWYRVKALIANGNISVYLDDAPLANLGTKSIGGSPTKTFAVGTYVASANFDEVYVIDENTGGGGTGESLSFTASQRQEVGVGLVSTTGNQYTVEAWAKVNSASGIYEIVGQNADGNDCKGTLIILDGKVRLELNTPAYTALFSSSTVPPNTWTHVAGVYDGSSMKIYINGNLDAQTSKSGNITSRNVRSTQLGGYGGTCGCSYWFDGLIDEVRIWNVARTQTQIQTDKNHEISAQSGLIGYWRFNEGSGSTTADNSGNGHTGILTNYAGSGMPSWVTQGFPASKEIVRGEEELLPTVTRLTNNYPNPFNPETIIRYEVAEWEQVRLEIYNILGQQVRVLVDEPQAQGRYQAVWDGRDGQHQEAASGMYFYRLITPTLTQTHKMVLVR